MHAQRQHARYSASNAHRWTRCAGQVRLAASAPARPPSEASKEGTRAHELLEMSLTGQFDLIAGADGVDPEMVSAVSMVHDHLAQIAEARAGQMVAMFEQAFDFPQSVVPAADAGGIADITLIDHDTREAWVIDFKYGRGVVVEARNNLQLLFYAIGALWSAPIERVHLTIIQPRAFHPEGPIRTWTADVLDLVHAQADMEAAIAAAEAPDAPRTPGPWCRWCAAEHLCVERQAAALAVAGVQPPDLRHDKLALPAPEHLGLDRLAHVLRHSGQLEAWLRAVESYAHEQARAGVTVPGLKLVEAQARRQWFGEPEHLANEILALSNYELAYETVMPRALAPITEIEDKLVRIARDTAPNGKKNQAAAEMRERLAFLTRRQSSGNLMLVPDTDARPAANRAAAAFGSVVLPKFPGEQ